MLDGNQQVLDDWSTNAQTLLSFGKNKILYNGQDFHMTQFVKNCKFSTSDVKQMELEVLNYNTDQIEKHPVHFMDVSGDKDFHDILG